MHARIGVHVCQNSGIFFGNYEGTFYAAVGQSNHFQLVHLSLSFASVLALEEAAHLPYSNVYVYHLCADDLRLADCVVRFCLALSSFFEQC
jgi:hypothetical protein